MTDTTGSMELKKRLSATISRTSISYKVLEPGDRIVVAISGGKDSYGLLYLLHQLTKKLAFPIELMAVHVSQGQPGHDDTPLRRWLEQHQFPYQIVEQDTYSIVKRTLEESETPCALCARLRRGILYTYAQEHGYTKIALGHHREDTLATLMMNLFYCGKMQAMPPKYRTDDGRFEVIRPMIEVAEADLIALSQQEKFPIMPCYLCSGQQDHKRKKMNELLNELETEHPQLKQIMLAAIKNIRPSHLLDQTLSKATFRSTLDTACKSVSE